MRPNLRPTADARDISAAAPPRFASNGPSKKFVARRQPIIYGISKLPFGFAKDRVVRIKYNNCRLFQIIVLEFGHALCPNAQSMAFILETEFLFPRISACRCGSTRHSKRPRGKRSVEGASTIRGALCKNLCDARHHISSGC